MSIFKICFSILLLLAMLTMGGLASSTCLKVFRLRNKRIHWRGGTLKGFPLFSTLFLMISFLLFALCWRLGNLWMIGASLIYVLFSTCWFISSYFTSKRYITDNGIVKNINDPAQTIAWHQVYDFFDQAGKQGVSYIFIYQQADHQQLEKVQRLYLFVPEKKQQAFENLLAHKLGRRINCYGDEKLNLHFFDKNN